MGMHSLVRVEYEYQGRWYEFDCEKFELKPDGSPAIKDRIMVFHPPVPFLRLELVRLEGNRAIYRPISPGAP